MKPREQSSWLVLLSIRMCVVRERTWTKYAYVGLLTYVMYIEFCQIQSAVKVTPVCEGKEFV